MKVLFLDMDGVMNSKQYCDTQFPGGRKMGRIIRVHAPEVLINPFAVSLLNNIILHTGCEIVISSAWRVVHPINRIEEALRFKGFRGRLLSGTPVTEEKYDPVTHQVYTDREVGRLPALLGDRSGRKRGTEIAMWLERARHERARVRVDAYAVLDDHEDDIEELHPGRFIKTTWEHGLQAHHVLEAVKILGGK